MRHYNKVIIKALFNISIFLILFLICSNKSYAWEAHLNENNEIEIYTVDKAKSGKTYYYTTGITITRCSYNPTSKSIHSSANTFSYSLDNEEELLKDGVYYNTWKIPLEEVVSVASSLDGGWGEEITKAINGTGPAVYIKLDCIMYINVDNKGILGPYINAPGVFGGDGNLKSGINQIGSEIGNYDWQNKSGIYTHYNHYLLIGQGQIEEPEEYPDELVTTDYTMDHYANIDANQPAFAMSNYSSEFDLSEGIPSSEYIENAFLADSWLANTNVYSRIVSKEYTYSITYIWLEDEGTDITDPNNPDSTIHIPDYVLKSKAVDIPIGSAYVAFQYLTDTNVYDFTNADISNGAYDGDHVYYDDDNEIDVSCISTSEYKEISGEGDALATEEPDWLANTDNHVEFPTSINYRQYRRVNSESEIEDAVLEDRDAIRKLISENTRTRNDKLVIEGYTFMDNSWTVGCNFFDNEPSSYKDCTESSAWVYDYLQQTDTRPLHAYDPEDVTGTKSVQIPATVDNGYYYTNMKVYYQRLINYTKSVLNFES